MTKEKLRIWKYRNEDYVSCYLRFETPNGRPGVRRLTDKELESLQIVKK